MLQVVPGTLEVSSTSIKLNWTCSFPDACQHTEATCRLAGPSSPACEAEEVSGVELLHGQRGTFTCTSLQPFTDYTVTISVPPSTVLFSWVIRTKEAGRCPWDSTGGKGRSWAGSPAERQTVSVAQQFILSIPSLPAVMVLALGLHAACGALQKQLCRVLERSPFLPTPSLLATPLLLLLL